MHTKSALFFIITIITALLFVSCGSEETTTNPATGEVLYSLDSISVWLKSGSGNGSNSQLFLQTTAAAKVKVEYTVQTNVDSAHSMAWVRDSSNGTPAHVIEQQYYWNVDSLVSYTMDIPAQPICIKLAVRINSYGSTKPYYIRLKNIKVTKQ